MDRVIDQMSDWSATTISDYSHKRFALGSYRRRKRY
ncbi:MAG: hypothetical protein IPL74_13615 [Bacteroidetes bacterium]|nr:hypothetical protein [Bacteroidota bacterium]